MSAEPGSTQMVRIRVRCELHASAQWPTDGEPLHKKIGQMNPCAVRTCHPSRRPAFRACRALWDSHPRCRQSAGDACLSDCLRLDRWITGAVQPAAMRWFGSPVAEIKQISAYSCRGMNGNPNARISEHAFGNALDMAAFTLADGRTVTVKNGWHGLPEEQGFLRDVQAAACDAFTTVLAPGSNAYHYDHIHVDLMRHASGYRTCSPHAMSGEEVAARAGGNLLPVAATSLRRPERSRRAVSRTRIAGRAGFPTALCPWPNPARTERTD